MPTKELIEKLDRNTSIGDYSLAIPGSASILGSLIARMSNPYSEKLVEDIFTKLNKRDPLGSTPAAINKMLAPLKQEEAVGVKYRSVKDPKETAPIAAANEEGGKKTILYNRNNVGGSGILHEFGHLSERGPKVNQKLYSLSKGLYPLGLLSAAGVGGYETGKGETVAAPYVAGGAVGIGLPHLIEEIRASANARHIAKKYGLPKPIGLNRALAWYILKPSTAAGMLAALGVGYGASRLAKEHKRTTWF